MSPRRKFQRRDLSEKAKAFTYAEMMPPKFNACLLHDEPEADCPWCAKEAEAKEHA